MANSKSRDKQSRFAKKSNLVKPSASSDSGKTKPLASGLRPDLAEPGPDGKGGDAGGVGKSI